MGNIIIGSLCGVLIIASAALTLFALMRSSQISQSESDKLGPQH